MKAILEFNLDDPEDQMAYLRCVKSLDMAIALFEIQNNAHRYVDSIDKYRENINNAMENINLNELIQ